MIYAKNGEIFTEKTSKEHRYQADDVVEVLKYGRLITRGIVFKSIEQTMTIYTNAGELLSFGPNPEDRIKEMDSIISYGNGIPGEYRVTQPEGDEFIKSVVCDSWIFNIRTIHNRAEKTPKITKEQRLQLIMFHNKMYDDGTTVSEWRKESIRKQRELSMRTSFWKSVGRELNELWVGDVIVSRGGRTHLLHAGDLIWAKSELEREEIVAVYPVNKRMELGLMNQGLRIGLDD